MQRRRLALVIISVFLGCGGSSGGKAGDGSSKPDAPNQAVAAGASAAPAEPADSGGSKDAASPRPPGPPFGSHTDELERLEGQGEAAVLAEFGEPTQTREFTMGECCHEFEIELYNTYPPGKGHDAVVIHQWTWQYEGYALTLWFHDPGSGWTVLDTIRYSDDVEF